MDVMRSKRVIKLTALNYTLNIGLVILVLISLIAFFLPVLKEMTTADFILHDGRWVLLLGVFALMYAKWEFQLPNRIDEIKTE